MGRGYLLDFLLLEVDDGDVGTLAGKALGSGAADTRVTTLKSQRHPRE